MDRRCMTRVVMHIALLWLFHLTITHGHVIKQCTSQIYCRGNILETVQRSGLFADSKTFVDMPTKYPQEHIVKAFEKLGNNPRLKHVRLFVEENFLPAGSEMELVEPKDWQPNPAFLQHIKSPELLTFARAIHEKWRLLLRRVNPDKKGCEECEMSSFRLPNPFIIPGGRFREFYYWDTFWIVEGLLVSGMCETVKGTIENMLYMINEFGFIPNGSRIYYLSRSQPPLLVDIIDRYVEKCITSPQLRLEYLKQVIPFCDREHVFWMTHRTVHISNDPSKRLNVYRADQRVPRPESFREDNQIANMFKRDLQKASFFQDIASAAESGWDFSGRWFQDSLSMATIATSKIIPVDLNSVLYSNEVKLSHFHESIGDHDKSIEYQRAAETRAELMRKVMYDNDKMIWSDYDLSKGTQCNHQYLSSLSPFLFGVEQTRKQLPKEYNNLTVKYPGGAVISEQNTGQQWDFPNVWAPYQHRLINHYLYTLQDRPTALDIAQRFVTSCYCGYQKYGYIFEKYHGERVGEPGGGGEYVVQEGFGWTNGVLLWLFETFPQELSVPITCTRYESPLLMTMSTRRKAIEAISIILLLFIVTAGILYCCLVLCSRRIIRYFQLP